MSDTTPLVHGKRSTYTNHRCRCEPCKAANARYKSEKVHDNVRLRTSEVTEDLPEITHGVPVSYEWQGCRCEECKEVMRLTWVSEKLLRLLRG